MERDIIKEGLKLLKNQKYYNQTKVVKKLNFLGITISKPTFSNIINGKKVRGETLSKTSKGIEEILKQELGVHWEKSAFVKTKELSWQPNIVGELDSNDPAFIIKPGFAFHENGRLPISKKVELLSNAQKEVIEFGITLRTYTSHFINRAEWEFKTHIESLLDRGVNIKCYLLNPECNEARLYFDDRMRVRGESSKGVETIKESIFNLCKVREEFIKKGKSGTFEIFTYKHIPYNHFMSIDGTSINGKMIVSHYIYGESRANCPVLEFSKDRSRALYKMYWNSLRLLMKDAKKNLLKHAFQLFNFKFVIYVNLCNKQKIKTLQLTVFIPNNFVLSKPMNRFGTTR